MYGLIRFVPLPLMRVVAQIAAWIAKLTNASIYRSIDRNLMLVNPNMIDSDRAQLATEALHHQMISTADSLKSWAMPPEWSIKQIKAVHNIEILKEGLSHPKSMLAIVPHTGTWEMMNAWINQFGKPVIMYKPAKSEAMDRFILQGRQRLNATLVPTDGTGVKAIFKTLKEGGFSIVLPDHVPDPSGGVIVPFFGIPTLTSTLASKLAQKTQCALVGLSCIRRDDNDGFEIFCYRLDDPDLYNKDIEVATLALNNAMQRMIEPHFSHYMWGYRRFKFTPFGENPYLLSFDHLHRQVITYKDGHS